MYEKLSEFSKSSSTQIFYFGVVLVLLLLITYYLYVLVKKPVTEYLANQIYTSGATMRMLGTQFSEPSQGQYSIVHNEQLKKWNDYPKEGLVSERSEPDFWEINGVLNAYKEEQTPY